MNYKFYFTLLISLLISNNVLGGWIESVSPLAPAALLDSDEFGSSVSMSGDKLAVGAPKDDGAGTNRGIVYTYTWSGSAWVESTVLAPGTLLDNDEFGVSVSMSGDKLAAGSISDDGAGSNRGIVYTFEWTGSAWVASTVLAPAALINSDQYGYSISMSGDKLAVGAIRDDGAGTDRGIVYTYTWSGSAWVESTVLAPAALLDSDLFGYSVSMSGDKLAVSAKDDNGAGTKRGIVYTYTWSGSAWVESTVLTPAALLDNDYFGFTVSMSGDKLAVGAYADDGAGTDRGIVYTFEWTGSAWVDSTVLAPAELEDSDRFGYAVSMSDDNLVVGAILDNGAGTNRGIVYTFEWTGSAWVNSTVLAPAALEDSDFFGRAVSISGDKIAAGSKNDNGAGTNRGIVYTFESDASAAPTTSPTAAPTTSPTTSPTTPAGTLPPVVAPNGTVVSKLEIAYELADESDASSTVESLIERADLLYPASTYRNKQTTVSITITGVFSNALYDIVNNEQLLYDTIKETKCGTATSACTITNPSARRVLVGIQENEFQFELVIELDSSQYSSLDGIDIEDPGFITALESTLGITHEETYTISTVDNEIIIQVSVISDNGDGDPLGSDIVSDANEMFNNLTAYATELVSTIGVNGDFITSTELIKCPVERTCNGQGHELCNEATGECDCGYFNGDWWWGIDCETKCECDNGAECVKGICSCEFPQWGLRCENVKDGCTSECTESNVPTYECCTGLDTPTDCGCCTSGAIPVDFETNGSCTSRPGGWCSSTQGEDTFGCFILP